MAIEIERKFLVKQPPLHLATYSLNIKQGYIVKNKNKVIRVRKQDLDYFLTIKGSNAGISRLEFEFPIPKDDAEELFLHFCQTDIINKTRYYIKHENHTWEVDEFHGKNQGLIIAELELQSEDEKFNLPDWIGDEISNDNKYFNMNLSKHPFKDW